MVTHTTKNYRHERAQAILEIVGSVKKVQRDLYAVKSQSGIGIYRIENIDGWKCNCPDHITRLLDCKHIIAAQLSTIQKARKRPTAHSTGNKWHDYTEHQLQEKAFFGDLLSDLCKSITEPTQTMGRPRISTNDLMWCSVQKIYGMQSSRRSAGFYQQAVVDDHISQAPSYNMINKFLNREDITPILHDLVRLSAAPLASIETHFSVDSSGFRTTSFNVWNQQKHGERKQHIFLKCHIIIGNISNIVTDVKVTQSRGEGTGDAGRLADLVHNTAESFFIEEVSADKAYSSRLNHDIMESYDAQALIPFKVNANGKASGSKAWKKAFLYFMLHQEDFYKQYHERSNVESAFGAIKMKFGETLKSRNETSQVNELLMKVLAYNITAVIRAMFLHGIQPDFFVEKVRVEGSESVYPQAL